MAITVKHAKTSTIPDGADTDLVRPSDWNAEHTISGVAASGTNSDITSLSGITGAISTPDYVLFDTTYSTALTAGQLGWDGNNTLGLGMAGGNVTQHIGEDQFIYVKASSAITKGQLIMFNGTDGASGHILAIPATGLTVAQYIIGIAAESLSIGGFGLVQTFGQLDGIDTSGSSVGETWANGDVLYYNSSYAGGLTKTFPTSGPIVIVAAIIYAHSGTTGKIIVRPSFTQKISAGTGISVSQTSSGSTITNSAPDQTVAFTNGTGISVTGTYPNFTITNTSPSSGGTVTSVTGTAPIASSGGNTPAISISQATTSTNGYLSSTDWNTFNGKGSGTVTSVSGTSPISVANGTTTPSITLETVPIAKGGTNQTAYTSPISSVAGLVWFDGTSFQNDTTTSHVGYNATTNTFYANNVNFGGSVTLASALPAAQGGTGLTSPGASGNVLTSNGTAWVSSAPSGISAAKSYAINMVLI